MQFRVLGALEIDGTEGSIEVRRGIPRVLLCALLLQRGEVVRFDVLIDRIWGDSLPASPGNALHTHVAYLRRILVGTPGVIRTQPGGYVLDVADEHVDTHRFEQLTVEGRRLLESGTMSSLFGALESFDSALRLWRGAAFEDAAGHHFALAEATRLEELRVHAAQLRIDALLALGRPEDVIRDLQPLLSIHPLYERFHEQHVLALYRAGRQADSLRAYQAARSILVDELGVEPGVALRSLEQAVIEQSPALDWHRPPGGDVPEKRPPERPWQNAERLIGRDEELRRVRDLLTRTRLLTLSGPGGAGKTAMALELARIAENSRRVLLVDLSAVEGDADVAQRVAMIIGADPGACDDADSAIVEHVGSSDALIILDTCEHVVHGVGALVTTILECCQRANVLATSRRPLDVPGEVTWPVPPLPLPISGADPRDSTAVQLFLERAHRRAPNLDLAGMLDDIAEICHALDGLPLAIELAAAQVDVLHPSVIRRRLRDQLDPFVGEDSGWAPRQRTLHSTIEWSVALLSPDERELLGRLTAFIGTFDLEAVIAIAEVDATVTVQRLKELVRSSLVSVSGSGRYRLLDTIRSYVSQNETPPADHLRRIHAEHYASVAAEAFHGVRTAAQREWLQRLRADAGNLSAALEWSFSPAGDAALGARSAGFLAWVWTLDGSLAEARTSVEKASRICDVEPEVQALVLLGVALLAAPLGQLETAMDACRRSADLAREANQPGRVADAHITLGVTEWALGDLAAAARTHDEAIAMFHDAGDTWGATVATVLRARTARDAGDAALAADLLDRAIDDARALGDAHVVGLAFDQLARLALHDGDHDQAVAAARECLAANESIGYAEGIVSALHVLARSRLESGNPDSACELQLRALDVARRIGHTAAICESLELFAEVAVARHDHAESARLLHHATRLRDRRNVPPTHTAKCAIAALEQQLDEHLGSGRSDGARSVALESIDQVINQLLAVSSARAS